MLHPCHKLAYFKAANWPDEWINIAKDLVTAEFECTYLTHDETGDATDDEEAVVEPEVIKKVCIHWQLLCGMVN